MIKEFYEIVRPFLVFMGVLYLVAAMTCTINGGGVVFTTNAKDFDNISPRPADFMEGDYAGFRAVVGRRSQ